MPADEFALLKNVFGVEDRPAELLAPQEPAATGYDVDFGKGPVRLENDPRAMEPDASALGDSPFRRAMKALTVPVHVMFSQVVQAEPPRHPRVPVTVRLVDMPHRGIVLVVGIGSAEIPLVKATSFAFDSLWGRGTEISLGDAKLDGDALNELARVCRNELRYGPLPRGAEGIGPVR